MKKKYKVKKKYKILFSIIIIIITGLSIITILSKNEIKAVEYKGKQEDIIKKELIENIIINTKDNNLTEDFLNWIYDNYKIDTLKKLNNYTINESYEEKIWHEITGNSYIVLKDLYTHKYDEAKNIKIIEKKGDITLSFVGDVSLADNWYIMPKYDERNKKIFGILSEDIVKIMTESDIMVANSEFTISDRGEKMPGKYYTFRASPKRIPIYDEMGIDLLTLANNHVYDFGEIAFNDMIDALNEYNMPYIGAGKNIEEAKRPYYFIINGYKIAFVNATRAEKLILTPEATNTTGGVFRCYDSTNFKNLITDIKKESDYVIALIHWGKEDSHSLEQVQIDTSKIYLDAGADIIIGSHAHVLQGIEFYNNKPIIYNLGDFIFNNESKDTGILQIKLSNEGTMSYYFIPAYESNEYTKLLYDKEKERVIKNMNNWSINAFIDNNGLIKEK